MFYKKENNRKMKQIIVFQAKIFLVLLLIIFLNFYLKSNTNLYKHKQKFILYNCKDFLYAGFGDQLKGLMSTHALSLLTNRRLLIKMTKKCDIKTILEPNRINWDPDQIKNKYLKNITFHFNSRTKILFSNETEILEKYSDYNLWIITSNAEYMKGFSKNPNLKKRIESLGYDQSKFKMAFQFKNWFDSLFKLKDEFLTRYNYNKKLMKPNESVKLVCTQIRLGDRVKANEIEQKVISKFWNFINQTFIGTNTTNDFKYSIYVTSDRENVKIKTKEYFKNFSVFYAKDSSHHVTFTSYKNACKKIQNAIFDFYMMNVCDIGVVSHSGFGILSLWNRKNPFQDLYVYTNRNQSDLIKSYWNRRNMTFLKYEKLADLYFL